MNDALPAAPETVAERVCPDCGYDLRAISSERCPECGLHLAEVPRTLIPWEHRRQIGRLKAFRRTLLLATLRPGRLARAVWWPVDARSASRFRWIIIVLATLPALCAMFVATGHTGGTGFLNLVNDQPPFPGTPQPSAPLWELAMLWSAGATVFAVLPLGALVMFWLGSRMQRDLFRLARLPQERQEAVTQIGFYACAPLAWLTLPAICFAIGFWIEWHGLNTQDPLRHAWITHMALGYILAGAVPILLWWNTLRLFARSTHLGAGRQATVAALLPPCWCAAAVIGLGLFPAMVGLFTIAIDSFR